MLAMLQGFWFAARRIGRDPGIAVATVLALAIGLGGATLVFSVARALLVRTVPYPQADRVVAVWPTVPSWSLFEEMAETSGVFDEVGAYAERGANLSGDGSAEHVIVVRVTKALLSVIGIRAAIGRTFATEEWQAERSNVAMLTDAVWRRRYRASEGIIGQTVALDGKSYTVIGVLPAHFATLAELRLVREHAFDEPVGVLVPAVGNPLAPDLTASDQVSRGLTILGRLGRGVSLERARAVVAASLDAIPSPEDWRQSYTLVPVTALAAGELPAQLAMLAAAVALLLLVACVNVASLTRERLEARRGELAVRAALGATFGHLAGVAVAETLLLALTGGAGGLLIAWGGIRLLQVVAAPVLTHVDTVSVNLPVLAFSALLSIASGLAVGLAPAVRFWRRNAAESLHANATTATRRSRASLASVSAVAQVAVAIVVVVVGALLATSLIRSLVIDVGFQSRGILAAEVTVSPADYPRRAAASFLAELTQRAAALPGAGAAALTSNTPGGQFSGATGLQTPGAVLHMLQSAVVSDDYFSLLSIPIVAGRPFTRGDTHNTPRVIIVNESCARALWGGASNAVGQRLAMGAALTVVGVAADARDDALVRPTRPKVYSCYRQVSRSTRMTLLVRAKNGNPAVLARDVAGLTRRFAPDVPVFSVRPLTEVVYAQFARQRLVVTTMSVFAGFTLLLAAVGVHGVLSHAFTARRREIGVRLALGGEERAILGLMLWRGMRLVCVGVAVGLPVALAVGWILEAEIVGLNGADPVACAAAVALVTVAGLVASLVPAMRAMKLDPVAVLRTE